MIKLMNKLNNNNLLIRLIKQLKNIIYKDNNKINKKDKKIQLI